MALYRYNARQENKYKGVKEAGGETELVSSVRRRPVLLLLKNEEELPYMSILQFR